MSKTSHESKIGRAKVTWIAAFVLGMSMLLVYGSIIPAFALPRKVVDCSNSAQNDYYGTTDEWGEKCAMRPTIVRNIVAYN